MRFLSKWSTLALVTAIGSGTLLAQPTPGTTTEGEGSAAVSTSDTSDTLTVADMQTQSLGMNEKVAADARHVVYLREIARKERDVIKLTCINDRHSRTSSGPPTTSCKRRSST